MDEINRLAKEYDLKVIEDAAQSFGATYKGKRSCNLSDVGCTSFFPAKPFGCYGDGGAVFTSDDELADKIKSIRVHGQTKRYFHRYIGFNARMDTVQAAVLLAKFPHYKEEIGLRQKVAEKYNFLFKEKGADLILPKVKPGRTSVWAQYSVRIKKREYLREKLKKSGIPTAVHYPKPLHLQEAFKYLGYKEGEFPVSEKVSKEIMSLPMNPFLTDSEIEYIVNNFN
jgi:UDP-2-acetamido-2-deoxy-ribo-hexuluronate aminotransferase